MVSSFGGYWEIGRENEFPFDYLGGFVWYGVIYNDLTFKGFTSSKSGKVDLRNELIFCVNNNKSILCIGIWKGEYKTALFVLDPRISIKKLS